MNKRLFWLMLPIVALLSGCHLPHHFLTVEGVEVIPSPPTPGATAGMAFLAVVSLYVLLRISQIDRKSGGKAIARTASAEIRFWLETGLILGFLYFGWWVTRTFF